ncbi:MAG: hypothetical protein HQ592_16405 [Planctomycetes bacterium]|nr:hypothetical protein [Planctomycetota bacterium]
MVRPVLYLVVLLGGVALGQDEQPLRLHVRVSQGEVNGVVANVSNTAVMVAPAHYGSWQFTTVLYFYGQRWHEAPLSKKRRGRFGPSEAVWLQPGKKSTFTLDLGEYQFPEQMGNKSKLRLVTCGLWSDIVPIENPNKTLH